MSIILLGFLMVLAGILVPLGCVLGVFLGGKFLLRWLDRALENDEDDR